MADTIEIIQGTATTVEVAGPTGPQGPAGAAGATGAQGPQGVPGTGLEVLTTQGDLLYQGASTGQRLPIGSSGQVLKVSGGIPAWANESGAVSSVAGKTGVVTLDKNDVGLGNVANTAQVTSVTGTAPISSSGGTTPAISISAATTSAAGSMSSADKTKLDGIAAGATANTASSATPSALGTAAAGTSADFARADHVHAMPNASALLSTGAGEGDLPVAQGDGTIAWQNGTTWAGLNITAGDVGAATASHVHGNLSNDGKVGSTAGLPLVTTTAGAVTTLALGAANQVLRTKSDLSGVEFADPAAAGVTSVTGTAPIVSSGGTTPAISVTVGTGANTVAAGNDSRITGAIQSTLVDAKGDLIVATAADTVARLPVGATNGHVLTIDSAEAGGMKWAAASGGVSAVNSTLADILSVSGSDLVADDLGADKLYGWDDSASKAIGFIIGSGLSVSGDTLSATASGGSKTYATFTATDNNPPATSFATIDQRNSIAVLDFDAATDENAVFVGIMPEAASLGSGLIVRLHWMATSATSGNVRWGVQFERSNTDLDADSFAAAVEANGAANGTSGILTTTAITVTTIDGITENDVFRLKVFRNADDATNDTMTGDAELVAVEVRSAA